MASFPAAGRQLPPAPAGSGTVGGWGASLLERCVRNVCAHAVGTALGIDDPDPLGHKLQVWDPDPAKWRDHATDERDALDQAWEQTAQVREELGEERGIENWLAAR